MAGRIDRVQGLDQRLAAGRGPGDAAPGVRGRVPAKGGTLQLELPVRRTAVEVTQALVRVAAVSVSEELPVDRRGAVRRRVVGEGNQKGRDSDVPLGRHALPGRRGRRLCGRQPAPAPLELETTRGLHGDVGSHAVVADRIGLLHPGLQRPIPTIPVQLLAGGPLKCGDRARSQQGAAALPRSGLEQCERQARACWVALG